MNDPTPGDELAHFDEIASRCAVLRQRVGRVIVGQELVVEALLAALLCGGHVLVIGVPGLAKTLLVRTLANSAGLQFRRIQFTPDLMPSDILGTELIQEDPATGQRHLRFVRGPVFGQFVLADEINRTPPRTQSALLEAMAERQVTVAGRTYRLDAPFVVVATQNPIEQEGTYPLPEAQLDRFMLSLWMDYPSRNDELRIVAHTAQIHSQQVEALFRPDELVRFSEMIWRMPTSEHVVSFAVDLVRATRPGDELADDFVRNHVAWGAGPRAGQALVHLANAYAAMSGEAAASVQEVRRAAMQVLRHRVLTNYAAAGQGIGSADVVSHVLDRIKPSRGA